MFRKKNKPQDRQRGTPSEPKRKSKSLRCYNYGGFDHIQHEYPSASRVENKALNATLSDNESSSDNQSEKSTWEDSRRVVAFVARVESGSDHESESEEDLEYSGEFGEETESEEDLQEAYNKMYEKNLKIIATNKVLNKKVKELKLEKGKLEDQVRNLTSEHDKSSKRVSELTVENETLDIQVKNIVSELELSRSQLFVFFSSSKKAR